MSTVKVMHQTKVLWYTIIYFVLWFSILNVDSRISYALLPCCYVSSVVLVVVTVLAYCDMRRLTLPFVCFLFGCFYLLLCCILITIFSVVVDINLEKQVDYCEFYSRSLRTVVDKLSSLTAQIWFSHSSGMSTHSWRRISIIIVIFLLTVLLFAKTE